MSKTSKAASEEALQALHQQVAEALVKAIEPVPVLDRDGKVVGHESNAAALNAAIRFLKDNGIEVARGTNETMKKLAERLPTRFDEDEDHAPVQ